MGYHINAAWRPVWSRHESPRRNLDASQSAACSMSLALAAKRAAEVAANTTYDLVWTMRCSRCRALALVPHALIYLLHPRPRPHSTLTLHRTLPPSP